MYYGMHLYNTSINERDVKKQKVRDKAAMEKIKGPMLKRS